MKCWKGLIIVLLIVISYSCGTQAPGGNFSKNGVFFTYPPGWSITEQNNLDGAGYYVSVEKSGFDESGLLMLSWVNGVIDSREYLEILQEEYSNQELLNDLEFQTAQDYSFNGIKSISCDFKFSTLGMRHSGVIYIFNSGEKTYSIIKQEATEDISKNKEGFDLMENTFELE